jgi:hypothetical protein
MSERRKIVPFEPSHRLCCPEVLVGMDGIFSKPSDFVRFCKPVGRTELSIPLVCKEERAREPSGKAHDRHTEIDTIGEGDERMWG